MLKTMLTVAGVLALSQVVQLPAADAQSGYSNYPGSPDGGARYRPTVGWDGVANLSPGSALLAPGREGTSQPPSSNPTGFVCCVSPEGRSSLPE